MRSADIFARAAEKDRRIEAVYARNAEQAAERSRLRAENRAKRQILGACWLCGSTTELGEGLTRFSLPMPLSTIEGVLCGTCRKTPGDLAELVTRRLWTTDLPRRWGWQPIPSRQAQTAVRLGYAVDTDGEPVSDITWTVARPWHGYTWAWQVLDSRRAGKDSDPSPSKRPFAWLR